MSLSKTIFCTKSKEVWIMVLIPPLNIRVTHRHAYSHVVVIVTASRFDRLV